MGNYFLPISAYQCPSNDIIISTIAHRTGCGFANGWAIRIPIPAPPIAWTAELYITCLLKYLLILLYTSHLLYYSVVLFFEKCKGLSLRRLFLTPGFSTHAYFSSFSCPGITSQ